MLYLVHDIIGNDDCFNYLRDIMKTVINKNKSNLNTDDIVEAKMTHELSCPNDAYAQLLN